MTIRTFPASRTAISLPRPALPARIGARLPQFTLDLAIMLAVCSVYFLLRGLAPDRTGFAMNLSERIVDFERAAGIFWEPRIQDASIQHHFFQEVANFTYAYLHFPVLGAVAAWIWWKDRERYTFVRNVFFISMAIGMVFYYLLPAAPPRLLAMHGLDLGFTDTVFGGNTAVQYAQPSFILNEYAAIPSFHFGWIALAAAATWANTSNRAGRIAALGLAILMTWAIVASANHFFIDMALGGVVIAVAWHLARRLERRNAPVIETSNVVALPVAIRRAA